jgi:4-aminobutyrate aminotransferase
MVAMDVVRQDDGRTLDHDLRDAIVQEAFRRGLLLLGCGEAALRFCPPLCITAEQVDTALRILDGVLSSSLKRQAVGV